MYMSWAPLQLQNSLFQSAISVEEGGKMDEKIGGDDG